MRFLMFSKAGRLKAATMVLIALLAAAGATANNALAADYPDHVLYMLVPFSAGGTTDLFARKYADSLSRHVNEPVVVENKAGASGVIAAVETAHAKPDGYTLFFASSTTMSILPSMMTKPSYDVERDFAPVALLGITPLVVAVNSSLPVHSLQELLALIKANPGKYSFGTAGTGSANHLAGELFKQIGGNLDLLHVPYKGSAPALQDTLSGVNPIFFDSFTTTLPYAKTGKMRILAVFADKRSHADPGVPTAIEAGMPGMVAGSFQVVVVPAKTPKPVVSSLAATTGTIMQDPAFIAELQAMLFEPVSDSTPERTREFIHNELVKWAPIIKATGVKLD